MMNKLIVANWKMNGSINLVKDFNLSFDYRNYHNLIICPPEVLIGVFDERINLGAQDCSVIGNQNGAFTGEASAKFLEDVGVKYVMIGHSERRTICQEGNDVLLQKLLNTMKTGVIPIFCIGENQEQYNNEQTAEVLAEQLSILKDIGNRDIIIAYEPVWSIGTGIIPTKEIIMATINNIREILKKLNNSIEKNCKLLYGGSVSEQNIEQMINWPVDGFLVGGASLDISKLKIIYHKTNT